MSTELVRQTISLFCILTREAQVEALLAGERAFLHQTFEIEMTTRRLLAATIGPDGKPRIFAFPVTTYTHDPGALLDKWLAKLDEDEARAAEERAAAKIARDEKAKADQLAREEADRVARQEKAKADQLAREKAAADQAEKERRHRANIEFIEAQIRASLEYVRAEPDILIRTQTNIGREGLWLDAAGKLALSGVTGSDLSSRARGELMELQSWLDDQLRRRREFDRLAREEKAAARKRAELAAAAAPVRRRRKRVTGGR